MLDVMMSALLMGALATVAGFLFERGLRNVRVGTRHAWSFALFATTLFPLLPRFTFRSPVADVVPHVTLPTIVVSGGAAERSGPDILLILWLLSAMAVALAYTVSYVRLRRARRAWREERMADHDVYVSERFGPAVFGFTTPRIVVPEWVRTTSAEEQQLIVLHEREHIRAGDQLLLLLSIAATVVMPWNPFVWLQARKLRFTLEVDCDQRVLAATPERERYATLLLDVGTRQMGLFMTAALAEYRNGLERRIGMIATTFIMNRWKAVVLTVAGIAITVVACESRLPTNAGEPQESSVATEGSLPRKRAAVSWADIVESEYPPLLRDAGIKGTVGLRVHVTDGGVADEAMVTRSSGHPELDAAAIRLARKAQWGNEGPNKRTDYWTTTSFTFPPKLVRTEKIESVQVPRFTPYTNKPELQNREETSRGLVRNYPPALRDAGIGGTVLMWVLVDRRGRVIQTQVKNGSGQTELDRAAQIVAERMIFSPALNGAEPVDVWIQLPIVFKTQ